MKRNLPAILGWLIASLLTTHAINSSAQSADSLEYKLQAFDYLDDNAEMLGKINDAIYSYSEIGFQEFKTIALIEKTLGNAGFEVETGVAGMPTAYMATYGSGEPVLGLMSDFDGVPGTSQRPTSLVHDPLVEGAPGHGEGHNSNQPTLIGAALAVKEIKDRNNLPGTIVVYGGPAEEMLASRGYMVNAGLFEGVDAIIDVHIGTGFGTSYGLSNLAIISAQWRFTGQQAHGARAWQGRSALDAVELMNVSTDFIREHMDPPARIHYVIPEGGQQPNVVPGEAMVWYYFRHTTAQNVWDLFKRGRHAAQGAALASDTEVTERILSASWAFNGNKALAELVHANIEMVGMPDWTEDDQDFAMAYQKAMGADVTGMPTEVQPLRFSSEQRPSSSDAGDVTWQAPYVRVSFPSKPPGELAGHHWSAGIAPATPIAHKGVVAGAKAVAASMLDMIIYPDRLAAISADFDAQLAQYPTWKSLIPPDAKPPIEWNADVMGKYRTALEEYEYDPESSESYLEFLGVDYPPAMPDSAIGRESNEVNDSGAAQ